MPLKLSLRPGEKFVVNGAVVQNGDRRAALVLQNKASVLREKDIMQQDEADTPAKRIYFPIMLMYLDEQGREKAYAEFASRLAEFMGAVRDPAILAECIGVSKEVMGGEYYRALMRCRKLITYEAERLGLGHDVDTSVPARAATQAEEPRDLEYRAFGQVTAGLVRVKEEQPPLAVVLEAIDANRRLWNLLSADCAAPENQLPITLRGQIISLAMWVARYSSEVLRDGADVEPLIDINRTMMEGLGAR